MIVLLLLAAEPPCSGWVCCTTSIASITHTTGAEPLVWEMLILSKMLYSLALITITCIPLLTSLQCYHCDLAANISCPGWSRYEIYHSCIAILCSTVRTFVLVYYSTVQCTGIHSLPSTILYSPGQIYTYLSNSKTIVYSYVQCAGL